MKNNFTKLMAIVAVLLMSAWSVNAQTYHAITSEETVVLSKTNVDAQPYLTATDNWRSSTTYCGITEVFFNMSSTGRTMHIDVSGVSSFDLYVQNSTAGRIFKVTIAGGVAQDITHGGGNCEMFSFNTNNTGDIRITLGGGGSSVYPVKIVLYPPSTPSITSFIAAGVSATIDENAKTITAELPYGTSLTSIEPVVTTGGTATGYSPTGAQDFSGGPINYVATDGTPANDVTYAVTLTVNATPSSDKDLSNVTIGGLAPAFDAGTNTYSVTLPKSSDITQPVVFTKPITASANFTSGNSHDFSSPLSITVTAQDLSTKVYTLTAQIGIADIAYVVNTALSANDTKIYPMLVDKGYYIKVIPATGTDLTQFTNSDLVIINEEPSSSNTLLVEMGKLIGVKPLLNFKAYMYSKTNWPAGAGTNGSSDADILIDSDYLSHPIFSGVTITASKATILTSPAAKGIQGVTGYDETENSLIGNLTSTGNEAAAGILENNKIPSAKFMSIGIANDSYAAVNADGLKLIENSVSYLLSSSVYGAYTSVNNGTLQGITFDGQTIRNADKQQLNVYDATGRLVASSVQDINMSSQSKGVYLVKGINGLMKIALTK